jgi:hypothetical protein
VISSRSGEVPSVDRIRDLVEAAIAVTDEEDLHRTMEELRSALHKHIERARQMGRASHPDRRPSGY